MKHICETETVASMKRTWKWSTAFELAMGSYI